MRDDAVTTFLFTDIEGSTRLWEQDPGRMRPALERHDAIVREAVARHHGSLVKMTGDGAHAAFDEPLDAIEAALAVQLALADAASELGLALGVRCGMHAGRHQRRDDDYFGAEVNRAARVMGAAYGGQVLLSAAVAAMVGTRLPRDVSLRDLGAVRLRDLGSPERIFELVHPRLRADFPALRSLEKTPNNLPHEVTSFVGREREVSQARTLLDGSRLLTVVGMGGIGKTRLTLHVAAEAMDDYPDGVWFVELAPLHDARDVAQAVAAVLGVKEEAGRPVVDAVARHASTRKMLFILDNCEHLLHGCAQLVRHVLAACPEVRILASSREPMHVAGEACFPLAALAVPDLRAPFELQVLAQNPAARLFIDRAIAAHPAFEVTPKVATAIAAICHRLDGIPLALELAAVRVRALSVYQIAERLTDRFKLLKGGDPTMLPRQQTLRALMEWSYDLLSEAERILLGQLSVFAGGWSIEAAEQICDCGSEDLVDLLARLVDKSLVARTLHSERYYLLETVRQFAQERLDASGLKVSTRRRHLSFYASLAERAKIGLRGPDQGEWLARLDGERENVLAAHEYAYDDEAAAADGLRLVSGTKMYWINGGHLEPGLRVITEALARPGVQARDFARCKGLFDAGQIHYVMRQFVEAVDRLSESLKIARELGSDAAIATVLQPLGMATLGKGDVEGAKEILEEALGLAMKRGEKRELAAASNALAQLLRVQQCPDEARLLLEQAVEFARQEGDGETTAIALLNLAMLAIQAGEQKPAAAFLLEVTKLGEATHSRRVGQSLLEVCGCLAASSGEWRFAGLLHAAARAHESATGLRRDPADEAFLSHWFERIGAALSSPETEPEAPPGRALSYEEAMQEARGWMSTYR